MMMKKTLLSLLALGLFAIASVSAQQKSTQDAIADYRASLQDGNPADLNAARGEVFWKTKRGPKNLSLESCDLGLGAGKVKGAVSNPAETGTLLIEFGTLAKLTGKQVFYDKAKRALVETYNRRSSIGLVGTNINVETGKWTNPDSHISAEIDS